MKSTVSVGRNDPPEALYSLDTQARDGERDRVHFTVQLQINRATMWTHQRRSIVLRIENPRPLVYRAECTQGQD